MLKYLIIAPLLMFGAVGCAAQSMYGDSMTSITYMSQDARTQRESQMDTVAEAAKASAKAFAERLATLDQQSASSTLSTTDALVLRSAITDRFHEAFTLITRLEDQGHLEDAAPAREIMQEAIDVHMHASPEHTPAITRDLNVFSKFMTETLIERSLRAFS